MNIFHQREVIINTLIQQCDGLNQTIIQLQKENTELKEQLEAATPQEPSK